MLPENTCIIETAIVARPPVRSQQLVVDYPPSDISEESLMRRYSDASRTRPSVVCELTHDIGLLHQYFLLCQDRYSALFGLGDSQELAEEYCEIMVARAKNQTIGGCALTIKEPEAKATLPMEKEGLQLAPLFPDLPITSVRTLEISHMAMLPDYQNSLVMLGICHEVLRYAVIHNVRFVVALAPVPVAKIYSKAAGTFGLKCNIFSEVLVGDKVTYEGQKLVLCLIDLAPAYKKADKKQRVEGKALAAA